MSIQPEELGYNGPQATVSIQPEELGYNGPQDLDALVEKVDQIKKDPPYNINKLYMSNEKLNKASA